MIDSLDDYLQQRGISDHPTVRTALTHRSVSEKNNERLEFLGDSILGFIIAESLYERMPEADEGDLSRMRASLVNKQALAKRAKALQMSRLIVLGEGEVKSGGGTRDSILADAFEAVIAAIHLTQGFDTARHFVQTVYADALSDLPDPQTLKDPKSRLQECLQSKNLGLPNYRLVAVDGKQHEQTFVSECRVNVLDVSAEGSGASRRKSEQKAASLVLQQLLERDNV